MKRRIIRHLVPTALGLALLAAGPALAASGTAAVSVNIVAPLSVTSNGPMAFGTIAPPSAGAQAFTLSAVTGAVSAAAGDGFAFPSTTSAAGFSVVGHPSAAIGVTATPVAFSDANLALATAVFAPLALDTAGTAAVSVGGTLTVTNGVAMGAHATTVNVTVLYQ